MASAPAGALRTPQLERAIAAETVTRAPIRVQVTMACLVEILALARWMWAAPPMWTGRLHSCVLLPHLAAPSRALADGLMIHAVVAFAKACSHERGSCSIGTYACCENQPSSVAS